MENSAHQAADEHQPDPHPQAVPEEEVKLQEIDTNLKQIGIHDGKNGPAAIDMMGPPKEDDDSDDADTKQTVANLQNVNPEFKAPKRDKSKYKKLAGDKPKGPKLPKPTGFEDYYVDPPLTPAEYQEEQSLYSQTKSFHDRYMLAIARYTNRRKFDEHKSKTFDRYMTFSGLGTGPKQFQGRVDEKDPDQTPVDIALSKSKYHIREGTIEESIVDFAAVTRGFLSSYLPGLQEMHELEDIKRCTNVIRNFLNYLLHHDVCPEYAHQLYDAKAVCDDADIQLPICAKLARQLPGSFNQACSLLFGGLFQETYLEDITMAEQYNLDLGMRREDAVKVFMTGLAATGTEAMVNEYNAQANKNMIRIVDKQSGWLQVVSVQQPSEEAIQLYSLASQRDIQPIGVVTLSHWRHPIGPFPEMFPHEVRQWKVDTEKGNYDQPEFKFLFDLEHLPLLTKGTKLRCTRYKTSFGVWYLDSIMAVLSPMFLWLKNEPYVDWVVPCKLPRKVKQRTEMGGMVKPDDMEKWDESNEVKDEKASAGPISGGENGVESTEAEGDKIIAQARANGDTVLEFNQADIDKFDAETFEDKASAGSGGNMETGLDAAQVEADKASDDTTGNAKVDTETTQAEDGKTPGGTIANRE